MGGSNELPGNPHAITKIYWQAYASLDSVGDLRVQRALFGVMNAVHKEVLPAVRAKDEENSASNTL